MPTENRYEIRDTPDGRPGIFDTVSGKFILQVRGVNCDMLNEAYREWMAWNYTAKEVAA